ncbi:MAG TPA: hypothetical protein VFQ85_05520 [Mycobacteriales bacterium]|jgi:hypothetical protein|nr:hypothetical protein [Mycobacteriales bacterium]
MTRITRRGVLGGMAAGVGAAVAGSLFPGRAAFADGVSVLPPLAAGEVLPVAASTTQLTGALAMFVTSGFPNPSFTVFNADGPLGNLAFTVERGGPGAGTDTITWTPAVGDVAQRVLAAEVVPGGNRMRSTITASTGGDTMQAVVTSSVEDLRQQVQPTLRDLAGTYRHGGSEALRGLPNELRMMVAGAEDAGLQAGFLGAVERSAARLGGASVVAAPSQRMLASLLTDPLILAYATFNPANGVPAVGPWAVTGAVVCLAGKYAGLTPAGLVFWGLGCTLVIGATGIDQSTEKGFLGQA